MLDPLLRRWLDPVLDRCAAPLSRGGVRANSLTLVGFAVGLVAVPLLAYEHYAGALVAVLVNRIFDGLDGAVARRTRVSDFGGYLDIVCDMLFYSGCVVGFALARPENLLVSVVLLSSFVGTASSFLGWAVVAATRGMATTARGRKSFYYSAGLIEGSETIAFLVAACLWPSGYILMATVFAILCGVTVLGRLLASRQAFGAQ